MPKAEPGDTADENLRPLSLAPYLRVGASGVPAVPPSLFRTGMDRDLSEFWAIHCDDTGGVKVDVKFPLKPFVSPAAKDLTSQNFCNTCKGEHVVKGKKCQST